MKKLTAILLIAVLIFSAIPLTEAAEKTTVFGAVFSADSLIPGELTAEVSIASKIEDSVIVSLNYYKKGGLLLNFDAKTAELSKGSMLFEAAVTVSLDIPETVSEGDFVKVIVLSKESLKPYLPINENTLSVIGDVKPQYTGFSERYYTIDSPEGSLALTSLTGTANRDIIVSDKGSSFRLKDMGEGQYAFENGDKSTERLKQNSDTVPRMGVYLPGNDTQRWILTPKDGGYYIQSVSNGKYLAILNGAVVLSEKPFVFWLNFAGETPFSRATALDGYKLLSTNEKARMTEIFTSVGASVFPDGGNRTTYLARCEKALSELYNNRFDYTAEEQKEKLLEIMSSPLFYDASHPAICVAGSIPGLPDTAVTVTQTKPKATKHEIWDLCGQGETVDCYLIEVTYKTASSSQTVNVYAPDPSFGNVQHAIEALGRFPYNYRKRIVNMYVYQSNGNTYNCGGEEMFVRLPNVVTVESIAIGFAHELGHSMDMTINGVYVKDYWCHGEKWQAAVKNDIVTVSSYGNTIEYENLAEFSRLYISSYDDRDRMLGVKQLFPEQYASFTRMLEKVGGPVLY